jgi:hypothetical protein
VTELVVAQEHVRWYPVLKDSLGIDLYLDHKPRAKAYLGHGTVVPAHIYPCLLLTYHLVVLVVDAPYESVCWGDMGRNMVPLHSEALISAEQMAAGASSVGHCVYMKDEAQAQWSRTVEMLVSLTRVDTWACRVPHALAWRGTWYSCCRDHREPHVLMVVTGDDFSEESPCFHLHSSSNPLCWRAGEI